MHATRTTQDDWSRQIGEKHGNRDRAAAVGAQARIDVEQHRQAECLERWPAIVTAMKAVIAGYNDGARHEAVTLVEDAVNHGMTVEAAANGRHGLVIALDGAEMTVRTRTGPNDPLSGAQWVSLNRTDENAAAYLLRDWLGRL